MSKDNYSWKIPPETPALTPIFNDMDLRAHLNPRVCIGSPTKEVYEELANKLIDLIKDSKSLDSEISIIKLYNYNAYQCKFCKHCYAWDAKDVVDGKPTCCDKAMDTWDPERKDDMWREGV